jgi:glycosyltransferase involved in cell wall biosynthesis
MVSGNAPPVIDGVGDYTARLIAELKHQRPWWRWRWLSRRPRWFHSPLVVRDGVPLFRPDHTWTARGGAVARAVARAIRPDVVHVQEQIHSYHETGAACQIARAAGAAVVTTLHEYHTELPCVVHTDDLVRATRVVISNDPRSAQRCLESTGRAVDYTWWTGTPLEPPVPWLPTAVRPGLAVTFGFVSALKSMGLLYDALRLVRAAHPGVHWRVIGPFEPRHNPDHAELAGRLQPDSAWVELTGAVPGHDQLRTLLAEAEMMLLPFADGSSTRRSTLQAAWAFGLPTVTTPPAEPTDAVVDGENCLLVHEPTPEAWAAAIDRVLTDRALADRLRAGGLRAADRFSWRRLVAQHLAMYDALLGSL